MEKQPTSGSIPVGTPFTHIVEGYSGIVLGNIREGSERFVVALHPDRESETCEIPVSSILPLAGYPGSGNLTPVYVMNTQAVVPVSILRVAVGVFLGNLGISILALIYYAAR
jgi:hypothetical protein